MSVNNQAQDRYNAPQNRAVDFEEHYLRKIKIRKSKITKNIQI